MSGRGEKNFSVVPSELRLTQKWDFAVENFITRPAVGLAVAGLISVVLFRKSLTRRVDATILPCRPHGHVSWVQSLVRSF
jgi:hypothetical protein